MDRQEVQTAFGMHEDRLLFEIGRLDLSPGDVLVIRSNASSDRVRAFVGESKSKLPDVRLIFLPLEADITKAQLTDIPAVSDVISELSSRVAVLEKLCSGAE